MSDPKLSKTELPNALFTPEQIDFLKRTIKEELSIATFDLLRLTPQHVEPVKRRNGILAYADGVNWDPGAGEGPYYYDVTGTWVKLF